MISIASSGIYNIRTGATTAPIPKPSGLAVGDLMIAVISTVRGSITTAPTGWTVVGSNNLSYNACTVYKKIADASDVSASTFSWVGTYAIGGIIYRIPEGDFNNIQMSLTAPLTPKTKDNAVILVGTSSDDDSDSCTFSGYSTTGGATVTYTEGYDSNGTSSAYYAAMGVASGIYSSFDNITAFNVTADSSPDATSRFMILIGDIYTVNHSDLFKNCLAYYNFEGNSNDSSVYALNGSDTDITYSDAGGKQGKYASFNGTSSRIDIPRNPILEPKNITISAWIKVPSHKGSNIIVDRTKLAWVAYALGLTWDGKVQIDIGYTVSFPYSIALVSNTILNTNTLYHIVATYDKSTIKIYINGVLDNSVSFSSDILYDDTTNPLRIGNHNLENAYFNGKIDQLGIWSRALSLDEVRLLYALPKQLHNGLISYWKLDGNSFDFVGKKDGIDTDITYGTSYGKIGQGALFNGSSSKILIPPINPNEITISAWVKTVNLTGTYTIIGDGTDLGGSIVVRFENNYLVLLKSYVLGLATSTAGLLKSNDWNHCVFIYNQTTGAYKFYINGQPAGSGTITPTALNTQALAIGADHLSSLTEKMNGSIDEIGIWNRALTGEEIQQLFYAGNANQYPLQTNMADMM